MKSVKNGLATKICSTIAVNLNMNHYSCGFGLNNVKLGGTIKVIIADKPHTLALVMKMPTTKKSIHTCSQCFVFFDYYCFLLECDGCGLLACLDCPLSGMLQETALI